MDILFKSAYSLYAGMILLSVVIGKFLDEYILIFDNLVDKIACFIESLIQNHLILF